MDLATASVSAICVITVETGTNSDLIAADMVEAAWAQMLLIEHWPPTDTSATKWGWTREFGDHPDLHGI